MQRKTKRTPLALTAKAKSNGTVKILNVLKIINVWLCLKAGHVMLYGPSTMTITITLLMS